MVGEPEIDLKSFQKLLFEETPVRNPRTTNIRNKRGLIGILGFGMKYLFVTVDARDVKRLAKVLMNYMRLNQRWYMQPTTS